MGENMERECAFCGLDILAQDQWVICDKCGKAYHKNCWMMNNACFTENCNGGMIEQKPIGSNPGGFVAPTRQTGRIPTRRATDKIHVSEEPLSVDDKNIMPLIGENEAYFRLTFPKLRNGSLPISWNWMAFLFTGFWMLYRKMYLIGIGVIALQLLISLFVPKVSLLLILLIHVAVGLFGNFLFAWDLEQRVKKASALSGEEKQRYLTSHSGIAKILSYVSFGVYVVLLIVLGALVH